MAYPLINGAAINGAEGSTGTQGIDLVAHQAPMAVGSVIGQSAFPLGFGTPAIRFTISPPGLDLARAEPHVIKFNRYLIPAGLDLVRSAPPVLAVRILDQGHSPLDFGSHKVQIGRDVDLAVGGIELARSGHSWIVRGSPPEGTVIQAPGQRAMELGIPTVDAGSLTVFAASAQPLEPGDSHVVVDVLALGTYPLALGVPLAVARLHAVSARELEMGRPSLAMAMATAGIDLCTAGVPQALAQACVLQAAGYLPLELGSPAEPPVHVRARQCFPLALGQPGVYRGVAC